MNEEYVRIQAELEIILHGLERILQQFPDSCASTLINNVLSASDVVSIRDLPEDILDSLITALLIQESHLQERIFYGANFGSRD